MATGIAALDDRLDGGLRRGSITVLGAQSGHGKTTIAMQFARETAEASPDAVVLFISPEMRNTDLAQMDILARMGCSREQLARYPEKLDDPYLRKKALDFACENLCYTRLPKPDEGGLDALEGTILMCNENVGVRMVVLDYAQYILGEIDTGKRQRFTLAQDVVRFADRIADGTHCAVLMTSQVNVTKEKGKVTSISLRESAIFEHAAAAVLYYIREFDDEGNESKAYFQIAKNRYGRLGRVFVKTKPGFYGVTDAI